MAYSIDLRKQPVAGLKGLSRRRMVGNSAFESVPEWVQRF
jgi:hypothetical protein